MSIADVTVDLQKTNSNIVRGILDNVYRVNTGLRIANLSILRNARDLIDNPIGGVIDSPDPTAVSVIPQPGNFYGDWVTPNLTGQIKGAPGTRYW